MQRSHYESFLAQAQGFPEDLLGMMLEDVLPAPAPPERIVERVVEKVVETVIVPGPAAPPDWSLVRGALSGVESARTPTWQSSHSLVASLTSASFCVKPWLAWQTPHCSFATGAWTNFFWNSFRFASWQS